MKNLGILRKKQIWEDMENEYVFILPQQVPLEIEDIEREAERVQWVFKQEKTFLKMKIEKVALTEKGDLLLVLNQDIDFDKELILNQWGVKTQTTNNYYQYIFDKGRGR